MGRGDGQPVQKIMATTTAIVNTVKLCQYRGDTIFSERNKTKQNLKAEEWVQEVSFYLKETESPRGILNYLKHS